MTGIGSSSLVSLTGQMAVSSHRSERVLIENLDSLQRYTTPHAVDIGSFNRVPTGPREQGRRNRFVAE